ncbi:M15 family metallopeptidase, partial [Moraxella bovis]
MSNFDNWEKYAKAREKVTSRGAEALTNVRTKGSIAFERITGKTIEQFQQEQRQNRVPTVAELASQYHDPSLNHIKTFNDELSLNQGKNPSNDTLTSLQIGLNNTARSVTQYGAERLTDMFSTGKIFPEFEIGGVTLNQGNNKIPVAVNTMVKKAVVGVNDFYSDKFDVNALETLKNSDSPFNRGVAKVILGESADLNAVHDWVDNVGGFEERNQRLFDGYSNQAQQAILGTEEAIANIDTGNQFKDAWGAVKTSLSNPKYLYHMGVQSVPMMIASAITKKPLVTSAFLEGTASQEQLRQLAVEEGLDLNDKKVQQYLNQAGLSALLITYGFGRVASKVGASNVDTLTKGSGVRSKTAGVLLDTTEEMFLVGSETGYSNAMLGKNLTDGIGRDIGQAGAIGGTVSGVFSAAGLGFDATKQATQTATSKATNTIKQKLFTPHEELINPDSKKYNPTTAYVNAVAELNRADTDEAKQVAQTKINEATNSVMSVLDGFDTKIANTTNQDEIDNLTAQKQSYIDTYVTPLQNTIQSVKDNAVDVHSDEFYLNLIGSVSKRVNPVVDISQVDTDVINQNQATNITEPTQSQPTSEQVSMKLGGKTYTAILKNDGDGQGEYFEVNTKNGKTKYYHYNEANPNEIVKFGNKEVHKDAVSSLQALSNAYQKQFKQPLTLVSGFRSYDYQQNKNLAGKLSKRTAEDVFTSNAWVGGSKHHTGLAFDFLSTNPNDFKKGGRFYKQGEWLAQNAEKFGLSLSYPKDNKGNVMYEAWEFVYQGTDRAKQLLTPKGANVITKSTSQKQNQTIHASHGFTDTKVRSVKDINHKFRMPFHNVNKSGGNSLFSGGVVKGDTLGFMALLDKDDEIFNASVGFTSITGGRHKKITGNSHGNGYKIDLDLKNGDDVETYARIGQRVADLAKQHGYIVQVNAEKAGWGNIGKRGDVNFINGGGSHLDITVVGRVGSGQGGVVKQSQPINTGNFSINNKELTKSNLMLGTYSAFVKAGFTDGQARYLIGEVNRENEFAIRYLFGTHGDKGNNKTNLGFVSWQGTRKDKLVSYLNQQVIKATHSSIPQTQESLDAMARFLMAEIKQGDITYKKYKGTSYASPNFLNEPNPDRNDHKWGHSIIGWAYGQTKLATGAKFNSKDHEAKLFAGTNRINELLGSNMTSSPINSEQSMNQPTQTQQDELSSQALSLIRELEETNGDNTKRIQELQDELTAVQEQLANINQSEQSNVTEQTTEQVQTEPEANGLDEQVIADVRANQLANITRRFSQRVIESDADYSRALTEIGSGSK